MFLKINNHFSFLILLLAASGAMIFQSCCNCDDCLIQDPTPACEVKNNTLIEFKAGVVKDTTTGSDGQDSVYFKPVENFAIETFQFPDNNSSSGSQPTDSRFAKTALVVAQQSYTSFSRDYTAVIYDLYPPNLAMLGDILVRSVSLDVNDPLNSTARLRFYGKVAKLSEPFVSENSGEFCEQYIPDYVDLGALRSNASNQGRDLKDDNGDDMTWQVATDTYNENDVTVLDQSGNTVSETVPDDVLGDLLYEANSQYIIDITVSPGEVYYVKARNGREFIMQISGMSQGIYPPYKKRVFIMFAPAE